MNSYNVIQATQEARVGLAGKRALVTGGTRRIGRAIVNWLLGDDVDVAFTLCASEGITDEMRPRAVPLADALWLLKQMLVI